MQMAAYQRELSSLELALARFASKVSVLEYSM
jgi:hypothetical protein